MTETELRSIDYLAARVAAALATDARTHALDVEVKVQAGRSEVVVTGVVSCVSRRRAAEEVIFEHLPPGARLVNQLRVQSFVEPLDVEPVDE